MVSKIVGKKIVDMLADITSISSDLIREYGYDKLGIPTESAGAANNQANTMGSSHSQGLPNQPAETQSTNKTELANKSTNQSNQTTNSSAI